MSMAVLFGYVFVHTGSIWLLVGLHFLIDLVGGWLAWQLLRRAKDDH
jgi:membrane protease YdiL (CAAX protease family)